MVLQSYKRFLEHFFTETPDALLSHLSGMGKRLFYDPKEHADYCKEHKLTPHSYGIFLGEQKKTFVPSPACIERIANCCDRKAVVDTKGAWLFLCGRDIFGAAVLKGDPKKGAAVLLYDEHHDLLGYGTWIVDTIDKKHAKRPVIKNELDMGKYLRR